MDNTAEQLRACPFCGGKGVRGSHTVSDGTILYNVRCRCGAGVNEFFYQDEADAAWNTRADSGEAVAFRTFHQRDPDVINYHKPSKAAFYDYVSRGYKPEWLFTQPSATSDDVRDAVSSLPGKWRRWAEHMLGKVAANRIRDCADELDAALASKRGE